MGGTFFSKRDWGRMGRVLAGESQMLLRIIKKVLKRARYPSRKFKYANNPYTDHQHVVLLALRQHFRRSYVDFCERKEVCTPILDKLGVGKVPHRATVCKLSAERI